MPYAVAEIALGVLKVAGEARNHHYIPQCYLRGFAHRRTKKPRLVVANLAGRRFFETSPRNVGAERDFNRIEAEGVKPDILETLWSDFEGKVAEEIRHVDETGVLEGDSKVVILNLAALLAVRHPAMREHWREFQEQIAKQMLGMSLATKERWESGTAEMKQDGIEPSSKVSYEDVKAFHDSGKYRIEVPRERHIQTEFQLIETVLPLLALRKWSIFRSSDQRACFITSDRPLVLLWRNPGKVPPMMRHSPGFAMQDTEVLFPLSKRTVIAGTFDQPEISVEAPINAIANANTKVIAHADRQLYCHETKFPYYGSDGRVYYDSHLFERVYVQQSVQSDGPASSGGSAG